MNPCEHGSGRTCQEPHFRSGRDAFHRVPHLSEEGWDAVERIPTGCMAGWLPLLLLLLATPLSRAQTSEAISREISIFNYGASSITTPAEAISREVSIFNPGLPVAVPNAEAISREVSVFNNNVPSVITTAEAVSREVSIFNPGLSVVVANMEAISRELSIFNQGVPSLPASLEAISREVSVFNNNVPVIGANFDAIAREVSIFNYGVPPIVFSVGSTNALRDLPGQVPLQFQTALDLTNLSLTLQADDSHLQILGVTPASPEVLATTLGAVTASSHPITFTLNPAAIPLTNHTLAYLNFQGVSNLDSAIVPLTVSNVTGLRASGQFAPGLATNGQVILIVNQPILFPTNSVPLGFTMYGIPGATYSIEAATNLAPALWLEVQRLLESGSTLTITGLTNRGSQQFYRAEQVGP